MGRSNRVTMETTIIFLVFCQLLNLWLPTSGKYYLIETIETSTNMTNTKQQKGSCTCNGALHLGRGECTKSQLLCDRWCYVDDNTDCPDVYSSKGAPYKWSCEACRIKDRKDKKDQDGSCTCNGALHHGRGECTKPENPCDSWCYVDDGNNCPDARPSSFGAPYSWSCEACRSWDKQDRKDREG